MFSSKGAMTQAKRVLKTPGSQAWEEGLRLKKKNPIFNLFLVKFISKADCEQSRKFCFLSQHFFLLQLLGANWAWFATSGSFSLQGCTDFALGWNRHWGTGLQMALKTLCFYSSQSQMLSFKTEYTTFHSRIICYYLNNLIQE